MDKDNNITKKMPKNRLQRICFFLVCFFMLLFHTSAYAHRVTIFAWVEGDTVYTQSKFSGGKKIKDGMVYAYNPDGTIIAKGITDENGMYTFHPPQLSAINIVLKTSMGHMATWNLHESENVSAEKKTSDETHSITIDTHDNSEIAKMIDDALDKKLAPIISMLANLNNANEPDITDIIGGLGYIFGLIGVALYVANKKKSHKNN